ncbi:MAG TPA: hypothetical protein VMW83_00165 [Spirochaetia bacterium]|nr:hypothetical protein [Spirochaetia bacterium]
MIETTAVEGHCINCSGTDDTKQIKISQGDGSTSFILCDKCRKALLRKLLIECESSATPNIAKLLGDEFVSVADQAIGLFLEYRDVHGYPEDEAKTKAIQGIREGCDLTDDVILDYEPAWLQSLVKASAEVARLRDQLELAQQAAQILNKAWMDQHGTCFKCQNSRDQGHDPHCLVGLVLASLAGEGE